MKKTLLISGLLLGSVFSANAQLLESENYNSLTVGNVGTNITGAAPGQGGIYTVSYDGGTNAANSNFQIVAEGGSRLNVLQMIGSNAATGTKQATKLGLEDAWLDRTDGNDIIQLEFSFFTGPVTTSTNIFRPVIFGATTAVGGFNFAMDTKILSGFAYGDFNNTGTPGNYTITLKTGGLVLPANTWIKVGFAYDTIDGIFYWSCNDVSPAIARNIQGVGGYEPAEFDVLLYGGTANTAASTVKFDDYTVRATPVVNLLSVDKVVADNKLAVYPNPAKNLINISNSENILLTNANITDLNGRTVKTVQLNGVTTAQINISDLASGVYMMNINSDQGSVTKKIVKE